MAAVTVRTKPRAVTRRPRLLGKSISILLAVLLLYLVVSPVIMLLYSSVKVSATSLPFQVKGAGFGNFTAVYDNPRTASAALNTVIYVMGSLVLGLLLSLGLTYLLERTDIPGRRLLTTLILSPMAVPPLIMAMAWSFLANPTNGPLSVWLRDITGTRLSVYSLGGLILVTAVVAVPSMYLLIAPQFIQFDAALEEAASASGASWWARMRTIILPLVSPALIAAAILFAMVSLEAFDIPAVLGFPRNLYLFSTLIQQAIQPPGGTPNYGLASGYGVVLFVIAIALAFLYRRATGGAGNRFRTISGKGYRAARVRLGRWRYFAVAGVTMYFTIGVLLPLLVLLWASFLPYYALPSFALLHKLSFANFSRLVSYPGVVAAAVHTLIIATVSATATIALASWAAWNAVRRRFRGSWVLVESSFLVLGVPGVVMGVALTYVYLKIPIPLYGTVWIIVVAYVTRFLAYSARLMDASFRQLDRELEEAAQIAGSSRWQITRRVIVPLMAPAIGRGWVWVAVHAVGELPMALLLSTSGNQTITVALWNLWTDNADFSLASALAVVLAVVSAIGVAALGSSSAPAQRRSRSASRELRAAMIGGVTT